MIIVCYDGSADAKVAIDHAGQLFTGQNAIVLTVWEPFLELMTRTGAGIASYPTVEFAEVDAESEKQARARAAEGAERAEAAGLRAEPRVAELGATIAGTILAAAQDTDAAAIVLGTRGLSGIKSIFLGSVSHAVLQHADRAVMVVPSRDVASERGRGASEDPATESPPQSSHPSSPLASLLW